MTLDRHDKLILNALQKDGRISNVQLAGQVSLSESACLRRVRALEESGMIRRQIVPDDPILAERHVSRDILGRGNKARSRRYLHIKRSNQHKILPVDGKAAVIRGR